MSALVLDAGALVAVDRDDRAMMARLRVAQQHGVELRSHSMVIAQVWRDPRVGMPIWCGCCARSMSAPSISRTATRPASC
jgi:hypothetical protein